MRSGSDPNGILACEIAGQGFEAIGLAQSADLRVAWGRQA